MYEKNNNWNMFIENDMLFLTKGADETYFLDEVEKTDVSDFFNSYKNNLLDELSENDRFKEVIKKLETIGVIFRRHNISNEKKIKIAIKYYGSPSKNLENRSKKYYKQARKYGAGSELK